MYEMKEGKLKTGTGKKVTNPKQATAIGLSLARAEGDKVPKRPGSKSKSSSKKEDSKRQILKNQTKKVYIQKRKIQ